MHESGTLPGTSIYTAVALALTATWNTNSLAADPDILWNIVQEQCVPNQSRFDTPAPCVAIDATKGYAIYKDKRGESQFLLIPTARVSGIEDLALLAPNAPAYWDEAWRARRFVIEKIGLPLEPSDLSLAVNSAYGRSQNQLHIHIDCIAPSVSSALIAHASEIGETWTPFPVRLRGHEYRARRVERLDGPGADPFSLVAQALRGTETEMARKSILVTGATHPDGQQIFYLLETEANPLLGNRGSAEELQDHDCTIARRFQ